VSEGEVSVDEVSEDGGGRAVRSAESSGAGRVESLRIFCAVELPEEVHAAAATHAARLRRDFPEARASWPRPESLHVTLKFVGEVEAARVETLSRAAGAAVEGFAPFELSIEATGTFPPRGAARVLWLGVKDASGGLARLQRRLEDECAAEGFPREPKQFKPHLTLARLRAPKDAQALAEAHRLLPFAPQHFAVSELIVMRSELGPGGSRYTPLSRHSLHA
jgi:RNA 2',3'-cyclic 3'-phosphodiesterase